jgi:MFS family permease
MPVDAGEAKTVASVVELPSGPRHQVFVYIGALTLLRPFTTIWGMTTSFLLKDQMHLGQPAVALYALLVGIPAYIGFLFGFVRDRWSPFGRRDQGFLLLAFGLMTLLFVVLGASPIAYGVLLTAGLTKATLEQFANAGQQGLTSVLGQAHVMSGRLAALWKSAGSAPSLVVPVIAGYCSVHLAPAVTFRLTAGVCLCLFGYACWRPRAVYGDPAESRAIEPRPLWTEARRLAQAPGVLVCVLLLFLWNFTPGVGTPLQFYMTDNLHGTAQDFGLFDGIFGACFVPTMLLHGFLCTRFPLRSILWASTIFAVPQILPLLMVHSATSAVIAAVPMGLMGGFATAAYFDLLIRACPSGLQGTAMLLGAAIWALSDALGNIAGAYLQKVGGFSLCAWTTFAVYACLLPVLLLVPRHLTATRDGQAVPAAA